MKVVRICVVTVCSALCLPSAHAQQHDPAVPIESADPSLAPTTVSNAELNAAAPQQPALPGPPPGGIYRRFELSIGGGLGWLAIRDHLGRDAEYGGGFNARLNLGLAKNLSAFMGFRTSFVTRGPSTFSQGMFLAGLQGHFLNRFYVRGGVGIPFLQERDETGIIGSVGGNYAYGGAVGYEVLRSMNGLGIGIEGSLFIGDYDLERWETGSISLVVNLFCDWTNCIET